MKTIVCKEPYKWEITEREKPKCQHGEALVRIQRIGICGTDLHAFCGNQPFFTYPRVLGHELSGTVEEISVNNTKIKVGDQVSVIPYLECGYCPACRSGKTNCCSSLKVLGVHQDGGMTEYISVPTNHLIKMNDLTLEQAAVVEPLSIGAHAVRRAAIRKGEKVLVIGAGPIGFGVMTFAQLQGALVVAMDLNKERLLFCKEKIGIPHTILAGRNAINELRELFDGGLPETVFDATGNVHSMNASFTYPEQGGRLVFVGLVQDNITFSDPDFHQKELTLMSSRNATREDFLHVKQAIQSGKVKVDSFLTHRSNLQEMPNVFKDWLLPETNVLKAIVEV